MVSWRCDRLMKTIYFYREVDCPVCRFIERAVLPRIELTNAVRIIVVDAWANKGTKPERKLERFSERLGRAKITPVIQVDNEFILVPKELSWRDKAKVIEMQIIEKLKENKIQKSEDPLYDWYKLNEVI